MVPGRLDVSGPIPGESVRPTDESPAGNLQEDGRSSLLAVLSLTAFGTFGADIRQRGRSLAVRAGTVHAFRQIFSLCLVSFRRSVLWVNSRDGSA